MSDEIDINNFSFLAYDALSTSKILVTLNIVINQGIASAEE